MAARFPAGAVHVSLDGAENAGVLVPEAAAALGVVAATAAELGTRLAVVTRGAPALLVLDGFDRYVEDAGQVGELLAGVPNLTVLATSRAPLRLTSEQVYRVQPLPGPNAAALFVARTRAVRGDRGIDGDRGRSSMRSARASTACRSRSSWPPTERGCCPSRRCSTARAPPRGPDRRTARPTEPPALATGHPGMVVGGARGAGARAAGEAHGLRGRRLAGGCGGRVRRRAR